MMETGTQFEGIISEASLEEIINEDGILCLILSNLTLKEAVRTSVLSTRWRHFWTHLTKFEFDAISVLDSHSRPVDGKAAHNESKGKGKTDKFIRSVDSVLHHLHLQGTKFNRVLVGYFLNASHSLHLDSWVRFAIASKAKEFGLHLFRDFTDSNKQLYDSEFRLQYFTDPNKPLYEFPSQLLGSSTSIEGLSLWFCSLKLPPGKLDGLSRLKVLDLVNVDIIDEDLNCILSGCSPTLMKLTLRNIRGLVSISAPYHLTHLKILEVLDCYQLSKIEINAVNLVKLNYRGVPIDFRIEQSLRLIDAKICFKPETMNNLDFYLTNLSSNLPRLQYLILSISIVSKVNIPKGSSIFLHLKHLDLEWAFRVEMNLHQLITVLDVAPFLKEMKLGLSQGYIRSRKGFIKSPLQTPDTPNKYMEMLSRPPHTHLKEIRISGFYFEMWQVDIAAYLLNNATELKAMGIEKGRNPSCSVSEEVYQSCKQIFGKEAGANVFLAIY